MLVQQVLLCLSRPFIQSSFPFSMTQWPWQQPNMTIKWKTAGCSQYTQLITQVPTCPNPLHHLLQVILHHLSCLTLRIHSHHSQCLPLYPITLSLSCQSLMNLPFSISHESSSVECLPLTLLSLSPMETQTTQSLTLTPCKSIPLRIINKFTSCLFF